jgi:hypothetical protein
MQNNRFERDGAIGAVWFWPSALRPAPQAKRYAKKKKKINERRIN